MGLPVVTEDNIMQLLPDVESATPIGRGGQKIVFRIAYKGQSVALKFALLPATFQADNADIDETILRAQRETQIMQECNSPHMVKTWSNPAWNCHDRGPKRSLFLRGTHRRAGAQRHARF